jgi:hypothetical protein
VRHGATRTTPEGDLAELNFSVDHRDPTSRGGSFSIRNTDIVCLRCNQIKGALTRAEFDG